MQFGFSDHSAGHLISIAATALGASIIKKNKFAGMVGCVRIVQQLISGKQVPQSSAFFKRSIFVSSVVKKGDLLTPENLRIARPGERLFLSRWLEVLNSCATRNLPIGHPLSEKDFVKQNSTTV